MPPQRRTPPGTLKPALFNFKSVIEKANSQAAEHIKTVSMEPVKGKPSFLERMRMGKILKRVDHHRAQTIEQIRQRDSLRNTDRSAQKLLANIEQRAFRRALKNLHDEHIVDSKNSVATTLEQLRSFAGHDLSPPVKLAVHEKIAWLERLRVNAFERIIHEKKEAAIRDYGRGHASSNTIIELLSHLNTALKQERSALRTASEQKRIEALIELYEKDLAALPKRFAEIRTRINSIRHQFLERETNAIALLRKRAVPLQMNQKQVTFEQAEKLCKEKIRDFGDKARGTKNRHTAERYDEAIRLWSSALHEFERLRTASQKK